MLEFAPNAEGCVGGVSARASGEGGCVAAISLTEDHKPNR